MMLPPLFEVWMSCWFLSTMPYASVSTQSTCCVSVPLGKLRKEEGSSILLKLTLPMSGKQF